MTQTIYVDDSIMNLIIALNKIKGVTTVASCGGHGNPEDGYIVFRCPVETSVILMKLVWRDKGLILHLYADYDDSNTVWGEFKWDKPIEEFQTELVEDLNQNQLLVETCTLNILPKSERSSGKAKWKPSFSDVHAYMTAEKFELLKKFCYERWQKRVESFQENGWDEHRMDGFPVLEGDYYQGQFNFQNYERFPAIDTWRIRWQQWRIAMSLTLHDYGTIRVACLQDIEGKTFLYDDVIRALLT